jgi:trk system potassium uptake protein TrkH
LPQCEAAFAFVLLIAGAAGLWFCETPWRPEIVWRLPDAWTPDRPVDFGTNQIPMRDDMSYGARWTRAVLVSTTLRSAGIQSIPVSHGALSWPSYGLLLTWMFLGGSAGGVAGGMRTSGLLLAGICLFTRRRRWSSQPGGTAARRTILRASLLFVPLWLAVNAAAIGLLAVTSEGTPYELILDGNAACNNVGLSTGLSLHLTVAGRMVMILTMTAGRFIPVWYWLTSTGRFSQQLRSRECADLCTS